MVNALVLCVVVFNMYNSLQTMVRIPPRELTGIQRADSSSNSLSSMSGSSGGIAHVITPLTPLGVLDSSSSSATAGNYSPLCQPRTATFKDFCKAIRDGNLHYVRNNMSSDFKGKKVNIDRYKCPILVYALIRGQGGIFNMLLEKEFYEKKMVDSNKMSISMHAYRYALRGKRYFCEKLFARDLFATDVPVDKNGRNALWHCIMSHYEQDGNPNDENFLDKVQALVDFGVDPHSSDNEGMTVLDKVTEIHGERSRVAQILKRESRKFPYYSIDDIKRDCAV